MADLMKTFNNFNVRIVLKGDYSYNDSLLNELTMPIVEFYDTDNMNLKDWKRGQFVSRYYLDTLMETDYSKLSEGLILHGGEPKWKISNSGMQRIQQWIKSIPFLNALY